MKNNYTVIHGTFDGVEEYLFYVSKTRERGLDFYTLGLLLPILGHDTTDEGYDIYTTYRSCVNVEGEFRYFTEQEGIQYENVLITSMDTYSVVNYKNIENGITEFIKNIQGIDIPPIYNITKIFCPEYLI